MKFKEYCRQNKISISSISKGTNISYSTVNDIINGKIAIENVALGKCKKIADYLKISIDTLYDLFHDNGHIFINDDAYVAVSGQRYYLYYKSKKYYMFKVKDNINPYVKEIAAEMVEDLIDEERLRNLANELLKSEG